MVVVAGVATVVEPAGVVVVVEVAGVVTVVAGAGATVVVVLLVFVSSSAQATVEAARTEHNTRVCKVDVFIK